MFDARIFPAMNTFPLAPAIFANGLITMVDPLLSQHLGGPFAMLSHILTTFHGDFIRGVSSRML